MVGLLLAPYNDSMRLGQGFNSFLQEPRLNNAVHVVEDDISTTRGRGGKDVSQVVSYTSRFVERISDVVRTMNLSAGSSIKKGTIEVGGNSLSLDETKFASSDLNAIVSVKVVNRKLVHIPGK
jgi:translation initiation factor 1 (eIF-1/SUI1)